MLDPALTYLSSSSSDTGSCARTNDTVECAWPTIGPGDTGTVRLHVRVSSAFTGTLKNTAKVSSPTPDPANANNVASVSATVTAPQGPPRPNPSTTDRPRSRTPAHRAAWACFSCSGWPRLSPEQHYSSQIAGGEAGAESRHPAGSTRGSTTGSTWCSRAFANRNARTLDITTTT